MLKSIAFKFFLVLSGILLLVLFVFGLWIDNLIKNTEVEHARTVIAGDIQKHARDLLESQSFVFGSEQASRERFTYFFNVIRTSEIVRIKVWNTESRVIFSDEESIIGKSFPDDEELGESLKGNVVAVIQKPTKPENVGEAGYAQLLEEYVPVYFGDNAQLAGVVEVYFNLDKINNLLAKIRTLIFIAMVFIAVSVFAAVWFLFWFLVRKRLVLLVRAAHEIAGGNLEMRVAEKGQDEISELAAAFNFMVAKLKGLYEGLEQKVRDRTKELEKDNKLMVGRELKMVELKKEIESLKKLVKNGDGNHKND